MKTLNLIRDNCKNSEITSALNELYSCTITDTPFTVFIILYVLVLDQLSDLLYKYTGIQLSCKCQKIACVSDDYAHVI